MAVAATAQSLDGQLRFAIANKRLLKIAYHANLRIVEPHDYGVLKKTEKLFVYQLQNLSRPAKGRETNWRLLEVSEIENCTVLDDTFRGSRGHEHPTHMEWDVLYIRVS